MLKGLAIFMVVMGHVITFCIRDIDRSLVFKLIQEIHMPLFFFISGWFTYKATPDGSLRRPDMARRAVQLLIPMVVVSSLWIWYFPHSGLQSPLTSTFEGLWSSPWKNGYWFTLVLFEILALYCAVTPLLKGGIGRWLTIILASWALLLTAVALLPAVWTDYASLGLAASFWPVFMFGAAAAKYRDRFATIVAGGSTVTVCLLLGACLAYFICWPWEFPALTDSNGIALSIARTLFHACLAVVAIAVVKPWSERVYSPAASGAARRIADTWQLLGRKSLAIYLLHYFFLFPMWTCRQTLVDLSLGFVPTFFLAAFVAAGIIALALGAAALIAPSPLLSLLLTGTPPPPKSRK